MSTAHSENPSKPSRVRRSKSALPAAPVVVPDSAPLPKVSATKSRSVKAADQRVKQARKVSVLLKFVSDPTRLQVILFLAEAEHHVGALCEQLGQSQPAVSHHLALLRHGGIIIPRRQGKNNFYTLSETGDELAKVLQLLMQAA